LFRLAWQLHCQEQRRDQPARHKLKELSMTDSNRNTFNRPDTMFGICEALGQDFGVNPLWIRLAFVPAIFFAPFAALAAYVGLGVVVLASRLIFPAKGAVVDAPVIETVAPVVTSVPAAPRAFEEDRLPLAA
jgi:phage shock protein C